MFSKIFSHFAPVTPHHEARKLRRLQAEKERSLIFHNLQLLGLKATIALEETKIKYLQTEIVKREKLVSNEQPRNPKPASPSELVSAFLNPPISGD